MTVSDREYTAGETIQIQFNTDDQLDTSATTISVNGTTLTGAITQTVSGSGWQCSIPFTPADITTHYYVVINAVDMAGNRTNVNFDFGKVQ